MAEAIILREPGGPEALRLEPVSVGVPGAGQLRLRQTAIGVNFHDIYVRSGQYRTLPLPGIPGLEGVGVVTDVGPDVSGFVPGDRIAYMDAGYGAYASERLLDARLAVRLPDGLDDRLIAPNFLRGVTTAVLLHEVHGVQPGDTLLVQAAAGGMGRLLAQWGSRIGARVIGTVGSPDKVATARAHGCDAVIDYRLEDVAARVRDLTGGHGADVIYDAVGADSFDGSLAALAVRGHLVIYGQASGRIPPFDIARLASLSATISRPAYAHYVATRPDLERVTARLFAAIADGTLTLDAGIAHPLRDAAEAHRALESRAVGAPILIP